MSTLLSTLGRQVTIPPSYLDIGMGGHFEECGGCNHLLRSGKFVIKATNSVRHPIQVVIEDLMLPE